MTNLALNQTTTASNFYGGFPPSNAVDGNTATFYSASDGANWATDYWQVDLGSPQTVDNVQIIGLSSYGVRQQYLSVTISNNADGSSATTIGNTGTDTSTSITLTPSGSATGRYVRIFRSQSTGNSTNDTLTLAEVVVNGTASSPSLVVSEPTIAAQNSTNFSAQFTISGGTAPYTAVAHRSTTSGFTPSVGTQISGASVSGTTVTLTDTTGIPGQIYFYKLVITDSTSTVLTTSQVAGLRTEASLKIVFIGDSITAAYGCVTKTQAKLKQLYKISSVSVVNAGVSGSRSNDWISGSTNLNNAKSAAVTALGSPSPSNPIWVSVMLGVNDARIAPPGNSPSTYKANLQSLRDDLITAGYAGVIFHAPPTIRVPQGAFNGYDSEAGFANLQQYPAQLDLLVGAGGYKGDRQANKYFTVNLSEFIQDNSTVAGTFTYVHPTTTGEDSYATFWSDAIARAIYPSVTSNRRRLIF